MDAEDKLNQIRKGKIKVKKHIVSLKPKTKRIKKKTKAPDQIKAINDEHARRRGRGSRRQIKKATPVSLVIPKSKLQENKVSKALTERKIEITKKNKQKEWWKDQTNNETNHVVFLNNNPESIYNTEKFEKNIGILIHLYYKDLFIEISKDIDNIKINKTLYFSLAVKNPLKPNKATLKLQKEILTKYPDAHVLIVENRGKDIGGKLNLLKFIIDNNFKHDWLIMLHDKKSLHLKKKTYGRNWRRNLINSILSPIIIDIIIESFIKYSEIKMIGGMVREGPVDSRCIAVHPGNVAKIKEVSTDFNLNSEKILHTSGAFIGGTMFWVDGEYYLKLFKKIDIPEIISKLETGNILDPSITHACERLLGLIITENYKIGSITQDINRH